MASVPDEYVSLIGSQRMGGEEKKRDSKVMPRNA